ARLAGGPRRARERAGPSPVPPDRGILAAQRVARVPPVRSGRRGRRRARLAGRGLPRRPAGPSHRRLTAVTGPVRPMWTVRRRSWRSGPSLSPVITGDGHAEEGWGRR